MDFNALKAARKGTNSYEALAAKASSGKTSYEKDPRFFVPKTDKDGNGIVIMRFLPHAEVDGVDCGDYVTIYKHGFQDANTQQYYIENSRTTIPDPNTKYGMPDPVSEANRALFTELGKDAAIEFLRKNKRNRQTKRIANVLILKNDAEPDTVGGVYLYEFGQKILDKILAKTKKDLDDDIVFDAFNMWEGAALRLKMKKVDGNRNYDDSVFDNPTPLYGGDDQKLEAVFNKLHSLKAEIAPDKFKSYEELKARFDLVTRGTKQETAENSNVSQAEEYKEPMKNVQSVAQEKPKSAYFADMDDSDIPF